MLHWHSVHLPILTTTHTWCHMHVHKVLLLWSMETALNWVACTVIAADICLTNLSYLSLYPTISYALNADHCTRLNVTSVSSSAWLWECMDRLALYGEGWFLRVTLTFFLSCSCLHRLLCIVLSLTRHCWVQYHVSWHFGHRCISTCNHSPIMTAFLVQQQQSCDWQTNQRGHVQLHKDVMTWRKVCHTYHKQ